MSSRSCSTRSHPGRRASVPARTGRPARDDGPEDPGGVVVERLEHLGRRFLDRGPHARSGLGAEPHAHRHRGAVGPRTRPWASTSSIPAPSVSGRIFLPSAARPSLSISTTGHTWTHTWFMSSLLPAAPRATRVRRIASRQFSTARSMWETATRPSSSRTTASWRTWARATSRRSAGFSRATHSYSNVLRRLDTGDLELAEPQRFSRRPTIGCTPRVKVSSTMPPEPSGRNA